jgi:hypothetical protein
MRIPFLKIKNKISEMRINLEFMTFQFLLILGEETIGSQ